MPPPNLPWALTRPASVMRFERLTRRAGAAATGAFLAVRPAYGLLLPPSPPPSPVLPSLPVVLVPVLVPAGLFALAGLAALRGLTGLVGLAGRPTTEVVSDYYYTNTSRLTAGSVVAGARTGLLGSSRPLTANGLAGHIAAWGHVERAWW
jgi:hypothetical protein